MEGKRWGGFDGVGVWYDFWHGGLGFPVRIAILTLFI